jgi:hypothetical protein|tara:strand:- start:362 stop:574 length:213 start_codon:yes stop_codon:yes gene_type:complete
VDENGEVRGVKKTEYDMSAAGADICSFQVTDFTVDELHVVNFQCLPPTYIEEYEPELGAYDMGGPESIAP